MKRQTVSFAICVLLFGGVRLAADDNGNQPQVDPAQIEEAFKKFATPGDEHEQFKRLVGTWDTKVTTFQDPTSEPQTSQGKATFRLLLGGRYLQQHFTGEIEGQKFEGYGVTGYDNAKQKYVGAWIDDMGTGIMHTEGEYDVEKHQMVETGESSSPFGPMKFKMISQYVNDDKFLFTMYLLAPDDQEQKMMEIDYTRADTDGE